MEEEEVESRLRYKALLTILRKDISNTKRELEEKGEII